MARRSVRLGGLVATIAVFAFGCAAEPLRLPRPSETSTTSATVSRAPAVAPSGTVVVAYPEAPRSWGRPAPHDIAGQDLQGLWGLPLFRLDPAGQLRPGLAVDWEIDASTPWAVVLTLAEGSWSDGTPVTADDVVATLDLVRSEDPETWAAMTDVTVESGSRVRLTFDRPYANWADLLVQTGSVLPAAVLARDGADVYRDDVPLGGGPFTLADATPGLSATFEAHPDSPLGPPALARLEVLFTPRYETALGLLEDGQVDALVGYSALNPVGRAAALPGVLAEAPIGGTWVGLSFSSSGRYGDDAGARRGVAARLDVTELVEGLLGPTGAVATTPWADVHVERPPRDQPAPTDVPLVVLTHAHNEVTGFAARSLQRDLAAHAVTVDLVSEPTPAFVAAVEAVDAAMVIRRDPPFPSLTPWVERDDVDVARAAHAASWPSTEARAGLDAVEDASRMVPLFRLGVLHAWRDTLIGLRPSAWPGVGFWNAGEWQRAKDGDA